MTRSIMVVLLVLAVPAWRGSLALVVKDSKAPSVGGSRAVIVTHDEGVAVLNPTGM